MIEKLRNYLDTTLPWDVGTAQYLRLFGTVFMLVFASSVVFHLLIRDTAQPLRLLFHGAVIGVAYTAAVALASAALYASRKALERVLVWHVWLTSSVAFIAGYYFLPFDGLTHWMPGGAESGHADNVSFIQLLPVWSLVTYFFVQPYVTESLKLELAKLRDVNAMLEAGVLDVSDTTESIRFQSGKTAFVLEAGSIRNIAVDDHYCYVHYRQKDHFAKRDLAMPLRDVSALLPPEFLRVHRSHIVNLRSIRSVSRKNRSIQLVLDGGFKVPVSRRRLDQVLPLMRQQLALNK